MSWQHNYYSSQLLNKNTRYEYQKYLLAMNNGNCCKNIEIPIFCVFSWHNNNNNDDDDDDDVNND